MSENSKKELPIFNMLAKSTDMAVDVFKILLMLKQIESGEVKRFYTTVREDFAKRLRIAYFEDDGVGELRYTLKYKHWWYIPFYFIFRDRRRILSENAIIVAEEYIFKLSGRKIKKGHTDFLYQ